MAVRQPILTVQPTDAATPRRSSVRRSLRLDVIDYKILAALHTEGRMSKVRLGETVHLSPNPCGMRVERLERSGLIRGYRADIDLHRLAHLTRFYVTIGIHGWTASKAHRFETAVAQLPNVVECEAVLGTIDYVLIVLADDVPHYQEIMTRLMSMTDDEFDYTTFAVSKSIKRLTDVPLHDLLTPEDDG